MSTSQKDYPRVVWNMSVKLAHDLFGSIYLHEKPWLIRTIQSDCENALAWILPDS